MKISHLALRGVAGVPDLQCELMSPATGRPHDLVVVSGPPASGKTRLCEVLLALFETVGPYLGIVRASDWFADPARGARVELDIWMDEAQGKDGRPLEPSAQSRARAVVNFAADGIASDVERSVAKRLARYDHDPAHGKREYFPEGRQRAWGAREDGLGAMEQSLLRSSKDPQKYSFVPRFLAELRTDASRRRVFSDGLERLSPTARYAPVSSGDDATRCFTNGGGTVRYEDLSSSEADAVLIAATAAMIGLSRSIVFLDRPELYVPPDRLVTWVHNLAGLGEDNQWIVATSDARLAAAVDPSQRISLVPGEHYPLGPGSPPSRRTS